jgi:hypothetical protein
MNGCFLLQCPFKCRESFNILKMTPAVNSDTQLTKIPGVVTLPAYQLGEYRLSVLNDSREFLHIISKFVTPCLKECGESHSPLKTITESPSKIANISSNSLPNSKVFRYQVRGLEGASSQKKIRNKKSRWTVPLSTVT